MKLYSYVIARDFGFAPNPFYQFCTLGTCKPEIQRRAEIGNWIVGTGSKTRNREAYIVFVMQVTVLMPFKEVDGIFCANVFRENVIKIKSEIKVFFMVKFRLFVRVLHLPQDVSDLPCGCQWFFIFAHKVVNLPRADTSPLKRTVANCSRTPECDTSSIR